jgi:hypothetical protein
VKVGVVPRIVRLPWIKTTVLATVYDTLANVKFRTLSNDVIVKVPLLAVLGTLRSKTGGFVVPKEIVCEELRFGSMVRFVPVTVRFV